MVSLDNITPEQIHAEAYAAATAAAKAFHEKYGEPFYCGFAWVKIRPARGPFVAYLKKIGVGDKAWNGGYDIWNPSGDHTQSMDIKEAGAQAYAQVLRKYNINAYMQSRAD